MALWNSEAKPDFTGENYFECFVLYLLLPQRDEKRKGKVCSYSG